LVRSVHVDDSFSERQL